MKEDGKKDKSKSSRKPFNFSIFLKDERVLKILQEIQPVKRKPIDLPYFV